MAPVTVPASEFKARCLRLLEEVAAGEKTLVITKRGRPIARVAPYLSSRRPLRGSWKDSVRVRGDVVHFSVADEWEANQ